MLSSSKAANLFKAISDETRLKIVDMLSCDGLCACDILEEFEITQPSISYHMKILTECSLVKSKRDGPWIRYTLDIDTAALLKDYLELITSDREIPSDREECTSKRRE